MNSFIAKIGMIPTPRESPTAFNAAELVPGARTPSASMDSLPTELLELILLWDVRMCRCQKNTILRLRLVCKAFDVALKPYVFKTVQLEYSRFLRSAPAPNIEALASIGRLCQAVYVDMMVVRDEDEISHLSEVFHGIIPKVPEMVPLLNSLRKYCLNGKTFDETDFRRLMETVLLSTPNLTRLKLNLPFQIVGPTSSTATLLLATTLACVAQRPEEFTPLETLVLDHVSDTTIYHICNNPMDLGNALKTFAGLKNLVISVKRQESANNRQIAFTVNLWFLIRKAIYLESLCIIGWNAKGNFKVRQRRPGAPFVEWTMRSLPYRFDPTQQLKHLRFLELKRVDIDPVSLEQLVEDNCFSLKELYLNDVYIKVFGTSDRERICLWIGHRNVPRPAGCCWLAESLRNMKGLKLDILRATGLGYDDFEPDRNSPHENYDLLDPSGRNRSFDQRFVEAVLGISIPDKTEPPQGPNENSPDVAIQSSSSSQESTQNPVVSSDSITFRLTEESALELARAENRGDDPIDYDAETFQRQHNTTSGFKRCIDGYFFNHNEQALRELQRIITVADRGMSLLSAQIIRAHDARLEQTQIGDN